MAIKVDSTIAAKARKLGSGDLDKCYHCGICTATCPLSEDGVSFPRTVVRNLQLGLKSKLMESSEPWLCYYCGDCSDACPQNAEPAESVMAARRYLTSLYDWTGLSYKMYTSKAWEFGAVLGLGAVVVLLFVLFHGPMPTALTAEGGVRLNSFAPAHIIELFDLAMGGILSMFLLSNLARMVKHVMGDDLKKISPKVYLSKLTELPVQFATQKRWKECEDTHMWKKHLLLVCGYVTMFIMIMGFLRWFQTDTVHPFWHPQRLLGYFATFALLYVTGDMMVGRYKKKRAMHKFSHSTDWLFLIMLFLTALTGILVHIFRVNGFPMSTYVTYVIHMAVLVPMLMIEVPFGKWSHLAYRPLTSYLHKVKQAASAQNVPG
ncbi:MAG: 4Fe-4S dicluster domain-containing protein [Lentisphaerae bacterium]|nr:4Fe-4S dicluster domain-containing protein [Lentisphaerota bacterium]